MCWVLVLICGIFHCSPQTLVVVCGLSCSVAGKNLVPWPRIKPEYSALQGRFLTTVPQGSPYTWILCVLSSFSRVQLFVTLWTVARQAPLSVGFSRQESWSGLPCPPPGDLPDPGIEPGSPALGVWSFSPWTTREVPPLTIFKARSHWVVVAWVCPQVDFCLTILEGVVFRESPGHGVIALEQPQCIPVNTAKFPFKLTADTHLSHTSSTDYSPLQQCRTLFVCFLWLKRRVARN